MIRTLWIIRASLCVAFAGCSPAGAGTGAPPSSTQPTVTAGSPSPSRSTCDIDLTFTGGIEGRVTGPQSGHAKHQGPSGAEIGVSLFFDVAGAKPAQAVDLQVFTLKGLWVTLGRVDTGDVGLWHDGQGGTATLAPDGSTASLDVTVTGVNIAAPVHVSGTITCPPTPLAGP